MTWKAAADYLTTCREQTEMGALQEGGHVYGVG